MPKKPKKWAPVLVILIVLAAATAVGVTLGFMFKRTNTVKNTFTPAQVSCTVHEKLDGSDISDGSAAIGKEKSDIRVRNTGNVKEYLRVRLVTYFVDENGNITGSAPSVIPEITLNSGWIEGKNNTYYYTEPVDPGEYTGTEMCKPFTLIEKEVLRGTTVTTVYQVVEVFAEAIQAEPDTAAKEAWNVTIDKSGTITAAN